MIKPRFKTLIPIFFSLIFIVILLAPIIPVVEVEVGGELYRFHNMPLKVEVSYIHSVEGLPVIEIFTVESSCIKLSRILWPGHGAGMPSTLDDIGRVEVEDEGSLYSAALEKCLGSKLMINVEYMANGSVRVGDNVFSGRVEIRIVRVPLVSYIFDRLT
ncbi:MAG: DUF1850 domain-containing protein [Thermoprotei archaeon]|nr:DUF1850 domain-containing protein [Thermoprotei archaeon]